MAVIQLIQERVDLGFGKITVSMDKELYRARRYWSRGRHAGSSYELHMVLAGAAEFETPDHVYVLQESHGILVAPNHPHYARSYSGEFERFYVHLDLESSKLHQILFPDEERCRVFTISNQVRETAKLILEELSEKKPLSHKCIRAAFHLLLINLLRDLGLKMEERDREGNNEEAIRRNAIDTFFGSNMPFGCSKERLARELGVSERQLGRILQDLYGKSFREMLLQSRMENAAWMLRSSDRPIGEVARALKYSSEVPFCQAFREWYRMTPSEYRKKCNENKEL